MQKVIKFNILEKHICSKSISDKDGNALQHLSYLPFGEVFANQKASGSNFDAEFKFLGKELDAETGYTKTDNRYYWAEAGVFLSVDPLCDERPWITPFNYAQNNPIGRKDPTGLLDDVYITGAAAGEATAQLQEATPNLKIKRDMGTGQLSYDGQAKTRAERKIARAIDDDRVTVFVEAGNSEKFSHIKGEGYTRGGSFLGNELCYDGDGNTFVETFQYVNPEMLANDFYGSTGQGMLHEISESYKGGRISLRKGITNVGLGNEFNRVYNKAHNRALPQPEWKYAPKPTQPATIQDIMEKANTFQQSQIKPFFFK